MVRSDASPHAPHLMRARFGRVIVMLVCVHACMAATRVTASLLVLHRAYPEWVLGGLLSLFAVAPIGLSLWAGRLADAHGLHRPLGVGVVLGFGGAAVAVVSQHPLALIWAALASGGGLAVAAVGVQREAGMLARDPSDLKRVFSWVALGPALSNALAPVVVGLLIDHLSYQSGFIFAAVPPLMAWWVASHIPRQRPPAKEPDSGRLGKGVWGLLRLPALAALIGVNLSLSACWDAHSFVVPLLGHLRGYSASSIGLILGSFAAAATLVRLLISRFADHLDERRALRTAMGVAAGVCLAYAWLPGLAGMMAGSAVLGLALGSVQPMVLAMLHQVTPAHRHGEALGLRMLATNAVTIVMPLGFGVLAAATVPYAPMLLMAGMVLLALWPASKIRL